MNVTDSAMISRHLGGWPKDWGTARIGDKFKVINGYPFDSERFSLTDGVPLVRIRDINDASTEVFYNGPPVDVATINRGDVIIGMDGDFNVARWKGGKAYLNQRLCVLRSSDAILEQFMAYFLPERLKVINDLTYSTTVKHLSSFQIAALRMPMPPRETMRNVVAFLDDETVASNALIKDHEKLLDLLEEKRAAAIAQAVTKGTTPGVPMKDSGVEWLGEVPKTWTVAPLRRFAAKVVTGGTPSDDAFRDAGLPWFTPAAFRDDLTLSVPEKHVASDRIKGEGIKVFPAGSVLVVCIGATLGKVAYSPYESTSNQQINGVVPAKDMDGLYIMYALHASRAVLAAEAAASTLPILNQSRLKDIAIAAPDVTEQRRIARYLTDVSAEIAALRADIQSAIELVKERRTSLITAACTGKIDVTTYRSQTIVQEVA